MFPYRKQNYPDTIFLSEYHVTRATKSQQEFWLSDHKPIHFKDQNWWNGLSLTVEIASLTSLLSLAKPAILNSTFTNFQFIEGSLLYCGVVLKFSRTLLNMWRWVNLDIVDKCFGEVLYEVSAPCSHNVQRLD